jgi:hypothetical protein
LPKINEKKSLLKELSIRGKIIFILYIAFTVMGGSGGNGGCDSDKEQEQYEPPPPPPNLNRKILSACVIRAGYVVKWLNRGPGDPVIFAEDGSVETYGLGYSRNAYDDVETFEERLALSLPQPPGELTKWSEYRCGVEGLELYRPGGRKYADDDCSIAPWHRNPCYEPDIKPGTDDCTWIWTGSMCYSFVYHVLVEADPYFKKILDPDMEADVMLEKLGISGRAIEVFFGTLKEGDLVFMDLVGNDVYDDHVGVISFVNNSNFDYIRCYGIIGFYSYPFEYRICEASMGDHNAVIQSEWEPISSLFYVSLDRCLFFRILAQE